MKCHRQLIVFILLLLGGTVALQAQRVFNIRLERTNANAIVIVWSATSPLPPGRTQLLPQFRVERSPDLNTWTPISSYMPSTGGQTFRIVDNVPNHSFYRVESLIAHPFADLIGANLSDGDLMEADFFGTDLFGANLSRCRLDGATLSGADIRFADCSLTDFSDADLFAMLGSEASFINADFTGADLGFADFNGCNFLSAKFNGADLRSANFHRADLSWAALHQAQLDTNTVIEAKWRLVWQIVTLGGSNGSFAGRDLGFANLLGANLNGANLQSANLAIASLRDADIRNANFNFADTRWIDFRGAVLNANTIIDAKSRLTAQLATQGGVGVNLFGTNLSSVALFNGDLRGANLTNVSFSQALMWDANLGAANLSRANCFGTDFFRAILTNANLTQADMRSTDLTGANLRFAITNGASFSGATFGNTIMPDGSIRNN